MLTGKVIEQGASVACVHIPHLAVQVETRSNPVLKNHPLVIGGLPQEKKEVFDCSSEAAQAGVVPGMPLREAHHLCPQAVFLPLADAKYKSAFEEVLGILDRLSPVVESYGLGTAFLDISGTAELFGPPEKLAHLIRVEISSRYSLNMSIGAASNKFVSRVAAILAAARGLLIVQVGQEREFLRPLPCHFLPASEETRQRLELLGLRTIGQVASLPLDAFVNRFGSEGVFLHRLANGIDDEALVPRSRLPVLSAELSPDGAIETDEALLNAIGLLLDKLVPQLKKRGQIFKKMKVSLSSDAGKEFAFDLQVKTPTHSKQEILNLLRSRLEITSCSPKNTAPQCPALPQRRSTLSFPRTRSETDSRKAEESRGHVDSCFRRNDRGDLFKGGITHLGVRLLELGFGEVHQESLLSMCTDKERRIRNAAKALKARFGRNPLKKVVDVEPESLIPERRAALVDFEP